MKNQKKEAPRASPSPYYMDTLAPLLRRLRIFLLRRLRVAAVSGAGQPDALRGRVLLGWLRNHGSEVTRIHVAAVDDLVLAWRGQGPVAVPGGSVKRIAGRLEWVAG